MPSQSLPNPAVDTFGVVAILLVGLAPSTAERFSGALTAAGHRVFVAPSVAAWADSVAVESPPGVGLVLLDADAAGEAPGNSLTSLVETLQSTPPSRAAPVVLVTGTLAPAALAAALQAGLCDWVHRDSSAAELVARVGARSAVAGQRAEVELGRALRAARQGAFEVDLGAESATFSPECAALLGDAPAAFTVARVAGVERLHPEDAPAVLAAWAAHAAGAAPEFRVAARLRGKRAEWRWVLALGRFIAHGSEGAPRRLLGTLTDVDGLKRIELSLRRSERSLGEAQRVARMGSFVYSAREDAFTATDAVLKLLGVGPDYPTTFEAFLNLVHPEDRARLQAVFRQALDDGKRAELEYRIGRPDDGAVRWIRTVVEAEMDAQGRVVDLRGTDQDVTDQKRLEAETRHAHKMQAVGQLAGGVAHDFNNLLAVILLNASMLQKSGLLDGEYGTDLAEIIEAGRRASTLTRQLLAFSRRDGVAAVPVDLNDLVTELLKMLHRVIGEDIVLNFVPLPGGAPIEADPGLIEQILLNLAMNARDAMPLGGRLTLEISARFHERPGPPAMETETQSGVFVRLSVRDSGVGMAPEVVPRVFEPFFTTKEIGKGSGLGLATVHGIVMQHGGWLEVETEVGEGTVLHVYFPWRATAPTDGLDVSAGAVEVGRGRTVLLVEDERPIRTLVRRVLENAGFRVVEAPTGAAALALWPSIAGEVALLLTDMIMPDGVTGGQLAQRLRAQKPALPVVVMSGYPEEFAGRGGGVEAQHLLPKPFLPDALLLVVRRALDAR